MVAMGLSFEGQRLAQLNFGEAVTRINKEYENKSRAVKHETPDGLGQKTALRQLYVEWLKEKAVAFIDSWLGSWKAEGTVPTDHELEELHDKLSGGFFGGAPGISVHPLPAITVQRVRVLEAEMHNRLDKKILEMKLKAATPQVPASSYNMFIEHNYGAVQQGHNNTQNVQMNQTSEALTNRLIEIVQRSALQPSHKLEVLGHVYQIQHLETLDQSVSVVQEKRKRLLTVDKLLSTTADVYTLAVPAIVALKSMFGG